MPEHTFTLIIDKDPTADEALSDALFAAGCDDAMFGVRDGVGFGEFDREADSFVDALASAIADVRRAGAQVLHVEPDDLVTLAEIAQRTGRSRESVRLLVTGKRGDGTFPSAVARHTDRNRLWRWSDVAAYFSEPSLPDAQIVAAVNARFELARLDPEARAQVERIPITG